MTHARRLALAALALTALGGCRGGELIDGGVWTTRSSCPQVAIPAGTGDVTLFDPAGSVAASAIDVVATITNLRTNCVDAAADIVSTTSYDVLATRRDAGPARSVTLPTFNVAMQGGTQVVAKRVGSVTLNFAAGQTRAQASSSATVRVSRDAVTLPKDVRAILTAERKPGDAEAAIDPMTDPKVRDAVARATFEQLIGFQLTGEQIKYNATR